MTFASASTNYSRIELTDIFAGYGAILAGSRLTNAPGASITLFPGAGGGRILALELDNQGTLRSDAAAVLDKAGAAHHNSGTITLNGDFTVKQTGAAASFVNTGSIQIKKK